VTLFRQPPDGRQWRFVPGLYRVYLHRSDGVKEDAANAHLSPVSQDKSSRGRLLQPTCASAATRTRHSRTPLASFPHPSGVIPAEAGIQ